MNIASYLLMALLEGLVCTGSLPQSEAPAPAPQATSIPSGSGWGYEPNPTPEPSEAVRMLSSEYFAIPGKEPLAYDQPAQVGIGGWTIHQVVALQHYLRGEHAQWQWDSAFRGGDLFTTHFERRGPEGARLVWRELARGMGRGQTLIVDGIGAAQPATVTRHGLRSQTHTMLASAPQASSATPALDDALQGGDRSTRLTQGVLTPLEVLERCRRSETIAEGTRVLHPHSTQVETLRVHTLLEPQLGLHHAAGFEAWSGLRASKEPLRYVRLVLLPSQTTSEYLFRGTDLLSFRLHGQGPWAERISFQRWYRTEKEYRKLAEFSERSPRARAMEAAAPFLDRRAHSRPQWYRDDGQVLDPSQLPTRPLRR